MNYNEMKFVIVGGGTAGWIASIYLRKYFPENSITVIESSEIGILGAGEGTTPHFLEFLNEMDINLFDLIKNTKATFKNGIKFTNWHGDDSYYFHPFVDGYEHSYDDNIIFALDCIANNKPLENICLSNLLSSQNKVKYYIENDSFTKNNVGIHALHFDARLMANYLKTIAIKRGVNHIDNEVISSVHDEKSFDVKALILKNEEKIDCDFVFDCTGFSRKLIGNVYKQEWVDYKSSLPVDRALPFFIENKTEIIPPYTEAIAMKYGWVWKIPVQGRYGCGYVFDSDYISDEEVIKEIKEKFGDVEIPRSFSFKAGYYKNTWVNNCVALGLASGFIEPLEATSIWVTIISLRNFLMPGRTGILTGDEYVKKSYNDNVRMINEQIKDFIQLHYLTKRNDSPFWKEYKQKNIISERNLKYYDFKNAVECLNYTSKAFDLFSSQAVFHGVKIYNNEMFKNYFDLLMQYPENKNFNENKNNFVKKLDFFANFKAADQYKFLQHINNNT